MTLPEALAEIERLRGQSRVTVGAGLSVTGDWEAVKRVQTYIMLDSTHPREAESVQRALARDLQSTEAALMIYQSAVAWALGEGDSNFRPRGLKDGAYWWRTELRARIAGVEVTRVPFAWAVKDYADGWILFTDEEAAAREAEGMGGAAVKALFE